MEAWLPAGKEAENRLSFSILTPLATISEPMFLARSCCGCRNTFFLLFSTTLRISTPFTLALRLLSNPRNPSTRNASPYFPGNYPESGLPYEEKLERIETLTKMLHEYEALPQNLHDPYAELRIINSLASLYETSGNFVAASLCIFASWS